MLEAALAGPQNHFAYQQAGILRLAAAYAYALTQNHPSADGNKRVALTVMVLIVRAACSAHPRDQRVRRLIP